ncbi:amino acid permease [Rothia sp. ZJ932]|uniref:amino acid permease n=1 Tax=Rothia sp. ZJ932 TaxID=2810516 RepID=UPI0019675FF8|nr:aromatic amino acid transport family protein [Rothia sp. ZJ932]QRZ62155.1 HAAAP family serine/threonine permease [Rothia sp. ZJ932]
MSSSQTPHEYSDTSTAAIEMNPNAPAKPKWNASDSTWTISLFGTAIGAGILFLPINAGSGGVWPLLLATIVIWPMIYFSHRALSRMVCASQNPDSDITNLTEQYFGVSIGRIFTVLYFCSIFPVLLIYGVGITNTVNSVMVNQLGMAPWPRWLLSGILVAVLTGVMLMNQKIMLTITNALVYPLILILLAVSVYLIPRWSFDSFSQAPSLGDFTLTFWLMLPVLVFSFYHAPAISQFSVSMRERYGLQSAAKASQILRATSTILVVFTMIFVWSCVLALGSEGVQEARESNLPILSFLANELDAPFIEILGPIVAITAISSSYFGHWLGAHEGAMGIIRSNFKTEEKGISKNKVSLAVSVVLFFCVWIAAILNPSILGLIETLVGPIMAVVLFLMPMYAIHKVEVLAPYRGKLTNVFVVIAGLAAFSAIVYKLGDLF